MGFGAIFSRLKIPPLYSYCRSRIPCLFAAFTATARQQSSQPVPHRCDGRSVGALRAPRRVREPLALRCGGEGAAGWTAARPPHLGTNFSSLIGELPPGEEAEGLPPVSEEQGVLSHSGAV